MLPFMSDWTWLVTAIIAVVTLLMVRQTLQIRSLPPGPYPLPIIGNILALRGEGNELSVVLQRLQKKYKDMFTLWLGPKPTIMVCTWDLCHEGLVIKRNDFSGRISRHSFELMLGGNQDIVFTDYGPAWETLRKILFSAVRKYAVSESLAELVSDVVDRTTETFVKEGKPVDAMTFMYLNIYNVLASSAFGVRFELDDPVFIRLRKNNDDVNEKFGNGLPSDALPFLKIFYRKRIKEIVNGFREVKEYILEKFKEHEKTYQSGDIRDFTDAVIAAREEAVEEGKEAMQYLTEGNMVMVLMNLFQAGTDTTRVYLMWIFLLISNKPEIQRRMQAEIDQHIGARQPTQKDRSVCHFINAVMTETLRYRSILDSTLEHKAVFDTELGGYKIPKGTSVVFYIRSSHFNENYWEEPNKFKPERFLDENNHFTNTRMIGYFPFGLGRRACVGEKLAIADTFLIVTKLLQKHNFELKGGPGTGNLEISNKVFGNFPYPFELVIKPRDMST